MALAQVPCKTQAVLPRHMDVDQRQIDELLTGDRPRSAGAPDADRRIAVGAEVFLQDFAYVRLVIDNQDCGALAHGRCLLVPERTGTSLPSGRAESYSYWVPAC